MTDLTPPDSPQPTESNPEPRPNPARKKYVPAVSPALRKLLYFVLGMVALLGANSLYLSSITYLEWMSGAVYQNYFYQYMFLAHLVMGLVMLVPFFAFAIIHMLNTRQRKNRRAVNAGYALFIVSSLLLISGVLLLRVGGFDLKNPAARSTVYWLHVITPLVAVWLYWLHRLAGPPIKWRIGLTYLAIVGASVLLMVGFHSQDPRKWNVAGPAAGEKYFEPSLSKTSTGNFIPAKSMMMDEYCLRCHADVHAGWKDSVHHLSSFNNPAYLASVREARDVMMKRDNSVQGTRFCAGCHDPVPFFSGAFDDPKFDDVNHPTAHAGVTCTVCHAITHINSAKGNGDYTIEEPLHYPFAYSDNSILQWVNNQMVKAKPSFHKKTFLKDFHKTSEFCSTCHKVHLPFALNHYKKFLRGQNHYDSFLLSGVSGHGARSFYYPKTAQTNCNRCHMPLKESNDFGTQFFDGAKKLSVHDHLFPSANTGIAWLRDKPKIIEAHKNFLEGVMRVDIFGLKEGGTIDGQLHAPLRPEVPTLKPGATYLLDTVIRTLKMGHHFTQGTVDSNEIWLDVTVSQGNKTIGRSGAMSAENEVDPWSHFVNVFVLDAEGNRIDRRNAQDIVVPLYNHQIPPGAGQTVHYGLTIPPDETEPITVEVKLQYRKFDSTYMQFIAKNQRPGDKPLRGHVPGEKYKNNLPVMTLATDSITFPVEGGPSINEQPVPDFPVWQRWNDYGIGAFLKGKAELRQAAEAFAEVEKLNRYDGPLNLARVLFREGRLDEAVAAVTRAAEYTDPAAPPWTMAWLSGMINSQQGRLEEAEQNFRSVLEDVTPEMQERKFDFSADYVVINLLGQTLFDRAKQQRGEKRKTERTAFLETAVNTFHKTLAIDAENVTAHYNLALLYQELGDDVKANEHQRLHEIYRPDDNARGKAIRLAREKYPAANHASEAVVIYSLQRPGAPGLSEKVQTTSIEQPKTSGN